MPLGIADALSEPPDVLVLGGGGILGEAWMLALLAGLEEASAVDFRNCGAYIGTSAGSIVSAALVAGTRPRERAGVLPEPPEVSGPVDAGGSSLLGGAVRLGLAAAGTAAAPFAALGLRSTVFGGAVVRRLALARVPQGRRSLGGLGPSLERRGGRLAGRRDVGCDGSELDGRRPARGGRRSGLRSGTHARARGLRLDSRSTPLSPSVPVGRHRRRRSCVA